MAYGSPLVAVNKHMARRMEGELAGEAGSLPPRGDIGSTYVMRFA